jgi:ribonuclease G
VDKASREIVIKTDDNYIYIALLENGKLIEFVKEANKKQFNVGDFYIGKVKRIMNGLNAAFIDIGH